MDLISDANAKSNEWVASLSLALGKEEIAPQRRVWVGRIRAGLAARLSAARGIVPPPSAAGDGKLNARILIPGGSFQMGRTEGAGESDERPQHRVTVSPFRIQEHEVTNEEYRRFLGVGPITFLNEKERDPNHDYEAAGNLPVVNVSWHEAMAYAAWLGGSLPTEAQWEFAARGKEGRTYPWGEDTPSAKCERANSGDCRPRGLKPVKTGREGGKTPEGVYDLIGNILRVVPRLVRSLSL